MQDTKAILKPSGPIQNINDDVQLVVTTQLVNHFNYFINNLIEFFNLTGILNSYISLKLIHLKSQFLALAIKLTDVQAVPNGTKKLKSEVAVRPSGLSNLLGLFRDLLVEIVDTYDGLNMNHFIDRQAQYKLLVRQAHDHSPLSAENVNLFIDNVFKTKFFTMNLQYIESLIQNLNESSTAVFLIDSSMLEFNTIYSVSFYEFKVGQNLDYGKLNGFDENLKILKTHKKEFSEFLRLKNAKLSKLHNRLVFG